MIQPDAKCVVNGPKVNEVINVLNKILNVTLSEEFDVVEYGNVPGRRWFFTGKLTGQKQDSASPGRDKLNTGSGAGSNNRDSMPKFTGGGGALKDDGGAGGFGGLNVGPDGGGMLKYPGDTTGSRPSGMPKYPSDTTGGTGVGGFGGGTDAFGNELYADGTRVTPGGMLKYPGDTTSGTGVGGFGGGTDAFGNELYADGTRVTPGGMLKYPGEGAPPLSGDSGRKTRTLGDWIGGNQPTRSASTGGGEGATVDGSPAPAPAPAPDQAPDQAPGGSALPKTESEYKDLIDRVRTGRASQEDLDIFQAMLNARAQNREAQAREAAAMRDPLEAQMHAKRQAAADRVAEENRMVWTYGQTGSKNTGANWLTKYTDNGGIYQR